MHAYVGGCRCGHVEIRLCSARAPGDFQPRTDAASCGFCRAHDGVWISDPRGELVVREADETRVETFASARVRFHFCARCDELVYATFDDAVAVARVGVFAAVRDAAGPVIATHFDGEAVEAAAARRRASWTPLVRVPAAPAGR